MTTGEGATQARARQSFMIGAIASLLGGVGHVAVGSTSPIPATASLLARRRNPGLRVSVLGSERHNVFTDGNRELFDCAAQGRIDAFFLSGGEIDGRGRINLVGAGGARFPGSFGSAFLYPLVPRVILFREAHSRRTLVETASFVSAAPGSRELGGRNEGPHALVTGRALFRFRPERARFELVATAPGETAGSVAAVTGFDFDRASSLDEGAPPSAAFEAEIDDLVATELSDDYPVFARTRRASRPSSAAAPAPAP